MSSHRVIAVQRESMNLLGLMVESLLQERLRDSRLGPLLRFSGKSLSLKTAGMGISLHFEQGLVRVENGFNPKAACRLVMDMGLLMDLVCGRLSASDLDLKKLSISGNPLPALALLTVVQFG